MTTVDWRNAQRKAARLLDGRDPDQGANPPSTVTDPLAGDHLLRPGRPGQRPHLRAVALPAPPLAALVQLDAQHLCQLLVHCLLDGGADLLVDQDSEGELLFMHQLQLLDSLAHGVFLRSSPCRATGWWFPNRKNAPFSFSTSPGTRPTRAERQMLSIHFICRGSLNVHVVKHPVYESGVWD